MSSHTGNLYTLRAVPRELLPRITVFLYGTDRGSLLDSLYNIALRGDDRLEAVILHDGPVSHGTYRALGAAPHHLPLRLLELDRPRGLARAVNAMLERFESDYVMILEAGDRLANDLSDIADSLRDQHDDIVGVYGDLELGTRVLRGERTLSRRRMLSRLHVQTRIAPPLLRLDALLEIGGMPADYPGQGFLLPDTALTLALFEAGRLAYDPGLLIRRPARPLDTHQKQDERALLNILLRRAAKRYSLPLPS